MPHGTFELVAKPHPCKHYFASVAAVKPTLTQRNRQRKLATLQPRLKLSEQQAIDLNGLRLLALLDIVRTKSLFTL
jgi:hypothetical protein